MMEIPPARDTDAEDVVWGLQTADALWKRGERIDALVWLRRAAQAAGEANDDDRALELARNAAELTDWMASEPQAAQTAIPGAAPQAPSSQSIEVDLNAAESARQLPHFPPPPTALPAPPQSARPMPPQSRPPSQPTIQTAEPVFNRNEIDESEEPTQTNTPIYSESPAPAPIHAPAAAARDDAESVLPAEKVHAGMFDPWAEQAANMPEAAPKPEPKIEPPPPPQVALPLPSHPPVTTLPSVPPDALVEAEEEVITSVRPDSLQKGQSDAPAGIPQPPAKPPPRKPPPLPPRALQQQKPPVPKAPMAPQPPRPASSSPRIPSRVPAPPTSSSRIPSRAPAPPPSAPAPPPRSSSREAVAAPEAPPPPSGERQPSSHPTQQVVVPSIPPATETPAPPPAPPEVEEPLIAQPRPMTEAEPPPEVTPTPFEPVTPSKHPSAPLTPPPPSPTRVAPPPMIKHAAPAAAPSADDAAPLELEGVEPFGDLPDDAREAFARAAKVDDVAEGDEVSGFALAYIMKGTFDVAATVVDAAAVRLVGGAVLRSRGTTEENIPMRLICAQGTGRVAHWSNEAVEEAFRTCPWVEDDLRSAADRVQTLVGITIGPLGERLDASIREQIMSRLTLRPLSPAEIVVNAGEVVPGLLLVGVGELELVQGEKVAGTVGSGEFLFPTEVLGAGAAPATARAGSGGALIMFGDRKIAQELLVTCPPLLEVFAWM